MSNGSLLDWETRTCPECGKEWEALVLWDQDMPCNACGTARYEKRLTEINTGRPFTVESIGGACPTQADGRTGEDRPFYFRARHGWWALKLGPVGAPTCYVDWPDGVAELIAEGDDPSAGFMEWDDVLVHLDAHLGVAA